MQLKWSLNKVSSKKNIYCPWRRNKRNFPQVFTAWAMLAWYMLSSSVRLSVRLSVRPSVCPSITSRSSKRLLNLWSHKQHPWTLVFRCQTSRRNFNDKNHNQRDSKYRWGRFKLAIFDQYIATSQKRCKIDT